MREVTIRVPPNPNRHSQVHRSRRTGGCTEDVGVLLCWQHSGSTRHCRREWDVPSRAMSWEYQLSREGSSAGLDMENCEDNYYSCHPWTGNSADLERRFLALHIHWWDRERSSPLPPPQEDLDSNVNTSHPRVLDLVFALLGLVMNNTFCSFSIICL